MKLTKGKIIIGSCLFVLILLGVISTLINHNSKNTVTQKNLLSAIDVASKYLQAREDSVGSDQNSPTSWLATIKPISTTAWYSQLQPPPDSQTGPEDGDYMVAHQNNYTIKAVVTSCGWQNKNSTTAVTTDGIIVCSLYDQTLYAGSSNVVPATSLIYGWSHNGNQPPAVLQMTKVNNNWLVAGDNTGQNQ